MGPTTTVPSGRTTATTHHANVVSTAWKSSRVPTTFQLNVNPSINVTLCEYELEGVDATTTAWTLPGKESRSARDTPMSEPQYAQYQRSVTKHQ